MDISSLMLARIQFAANITFHILFPSISIGMGWVLLYFKLRHNREVHDARATAASHSSKWLDAYRFWIKVFALTFALGVVSGVTMSFQFGTNWPGFMNTVGNIAGHEDAGYSRTNVSVAGNDVALGVAVELVADEVGVGSVPDSEEHGAGGKIPLLARLEVAQA